MSGANANVVLGIQAVDNSNAAFAKTRSNIQSLRTGVNGMAGTSIRGRRAIQQFGMQLSDFSVQVAGGQSAILAFTQQVPQFIQGFGAMGGILAALITILGTVALVLYNTGTSLSQISPLMGVLRVEFEMLANGLIYVKELFIDFANLVINNLDRVLITASLLASYFLGGWIASMVASTAATMTLAGAIGFLNAVMKKVIFVSILIAAAELVRWFLRLVEAAGSFGNALSMIWDVAEEVFSKIKSLIEGLASTFAYAAHSLKSMFISAIVAVLAAFDQLIQNIAAGFNSVFGTNIKGSSLGVKLSEAGTALPGFAKGSVLYDLMGALEESDIAKSDAWNSADAAFGNAAAPLKSIQAIKDAMASLPPDNEVDIRNWFGGISGEGGGGGGGGAAGAKDAIEKMVTAAELGMQKLTELRDSVGQTISSGIMSVIDGTAKMGDAVKSTVAEIIKEIVNVMIVQTAVARMMNWVGGFFGIAPSALPSFEGGGRTASGSRSGGVDGRGGQMAIIHPDETIIDHRKQGMSKADGNGNTIVVNQVINLSAGVSATIKSELNAMLPTIKKAAVEAVVAAKRRGGNVGRAI